MDNVEFDVAYRLGEYQKFSIEHVRHTSGNELGAVARFLLAAFAIPVFFLKSRKVGRCAFTVNAEGISRRSRHGKLNIPWLDVIAVHRYSPGLLIEKARGAVPIPYRCLSAEQLSSIEELVARWEKARGVNK